jgi:hypothetical protein
MSPAALPLCRLVAFSSNAVSGYTHTLSLLLAGCSTTTLDRREGFHRPGRHAAQVAESARGRAQQPRVGCRKPEVQPVAVRPDGLRDEGRAQLRVDSQGGRRDDCGRGRREGDGGGAVLCGVCGVGMWVEVGAVRGPLLAVGVTLFLSCSSHACGTKQRRCPLLPATAQAHGCHLPPSKRRECSARLGPGPSRGEADGWRPWARAQKKHKQTHRTHGLSASAGSPTDGGGPTSSSSPASAAAGGGGAGGARVAISELSFCVCGVISTSSVLYTSVVFLVLLIVFFFRTRNNAASLQPRPRLVRTRTHALAPQATRSQHAWRWSGPPLPRRRRARTWTAVGPALRPPARATAATPRPRATCTLA